MQAFIRKQSEKTISIDQLKKLVPHYCKVIKYDNLRGKTLKDVMGRYTVLILLWNIHDKKHRILNEPGHFWCISTRGPEECVVFSSTGMSLTKELLITASDPLMLQKILPKKTIYNNVKLQSDGLSNTCWRYCLAFAHLAPIGLKKFQEIFRRPHLSLHTSDDLVTALTCLALLV